MKGKFQSKQRRVAHYGTLQYKEAKIKAPQKTCQFSLAMALTDINISDEPRMSGF